MVIGSRLANFHSEDKQVKGGGSAEGVIVVVLYFMRFDSTAVRGSCMVYVIVSLFGATHAYLYTDYGNQWNITLTHVDGTLLLLVTVVSGSAVFGVFI